MRSDAVIVCPSLLLGIKFSESNSKGMGNHLVGACEGRLRDLRWLGLTLICKPADVLRVILSWKVLIDYQMPILCVYRSCDMRTNSQLSTSEHIPLQQRSIQSLSISFLNVLHLHSKPHTYLPSILPPLLFNPAPSSLFPCCPCLQIAA